MGGVIKFSTYASHGLIHEENFLLRKEFIRWEKGNKKENLKDLEMIELEIDSLMGQLDED